MMGQAMINSTLGNWDEAERLSNEAVSLSGRHNLLLAQMAITYSIGRDRGQQAELAQLEHRLGGFVDQNPLFLAAFALVHAESDQFDDARRLLTTLHQQGPWPRNWLWLGTMVAALEASVLAGEHELIRRYSAVLTRYSGQWALAGAELACWGPVDRVLGLAHAAFGRLDGTRCSRRRCRPQLRRGPRRGWCAAPRVSMASRPVPADPAGTQPRPCSNGARSGVSRH